MLITEITDRVNSALAGEMLPLSNLKYLLDEVIDNINTELNTKFPTISDWPAFVTNYNNTNPAPTVLLDPLNYTAFPDNYIRSVLVKGAAYTFYVNDEEGEVVAPLFGAAYSKGLYMMVRDYLVLVPEIFVNDTGGYVNLKLGYDSGVVGVEINGTDISI